MTPPENDYSSHEITLQCPLQRFMLFPIKNSRGLFILSPALLIAMPHPLTWTQPQGVHLDLIFRHSRRFGFIGVLSPMASQDNLVIRE